ncbi:5-fold beta-flower protein [Mucilaginibacter sp. 22184]|uniref:5-fold beta-flower protein n=1 Tax=Mucilaginibacter sp. 22184 TaxID=3453887 RepID=UPI003F8491E9
MKKINFLLFILTMITAVTVNAQTPKDTTFKVYINAKGGIHNHGGTPLGYIDKDNIVRDNKGQKLYFIDGAGNVIDANGKKLGMAKKNGAYYNINGENILNTKDLDKEKCAILDPKGHNFGTAHLNYKLHACAAHCYFLEQQKKKDEAKKAKA